MSQSTLATHLNQTHVSLSPPVAMETIEVPCVSSGGTLLESAYDSDVCPSLSVRESCGCVLLSDLPCSCSVVFILYIFFSI